MTHLMTHYTTYDQAYYYADLKRLPRLSEAQRRSLLSQLSTAASPSLRASLTEQLVESYLPFATAIVIQLCPLSRFQRDLPDLIGVANLTVVEVLSRRERTHLDEPTSYLAAWIRGRVRGTLAQGLVTMPYQARVRVREQGETDQAYALAHMLSLDEPREWFESGEMEEPLVTPLLPSGAAPARDPQQRAQVETWLSYLSPRAQAILRLRYPRDAQRVF